MTQAALPANSPAPSRAATLAHTALRLALYTLGFVALLALTFMALGVKPDVALRALWVGAFGDASGHLYPISETLVEATPLLLTGLGIVVAWRTGLFSIGAEGQLLVGALAATALGRLYPALPAPLVTALMVVGGVTAGALWSGIAGWLRVRRGVQEVISTIMLNYVALYLLRWAVEGPLQERTRSGPQSDPLSDAVLLARLIPPSLSGGVATRLHAGFVIALLSVPVLWLLLYRTPLGFGLRLTGQNAEAAHTARYPVDRLRIRAMLFSGALSGLAGVVELLGVSGRLDASFSPGWGYTAIPVALLGGLNPLGTLISSLFFGALTAGCGELSRTHAVSVVVIYVIQAAAVLAVVGARGWQARRTNTEE